MVIRESNNEIEKLCRGSKKLSIFKTLIKTNIWQYWTKKKNTYKHVRNEKRETMTRFRQEFFKVLKEYYK